MPTDTVTLDRELVERFIVEVDGIAEFEIIRNGHVETWFTNHIYRVLGEFEEATLGELDDEGAEKLHDRGSERGRELAREAFARVFEREEVATDA